MIKRISRVAGTSLVLSFLISLMHINILHKYDEKRCLLLRLFYINSRIYFVFHAVFLQSFLKRMFQFTEFYLRKIFYTDVGELLYNKLWTTVGHHQLRDGNGRYNADCVGCGNYFNVNGPCRSKGFTEGI
jgi:hypothetical protein